MRLLKVACGLAVALALSGCGGGSASTPASASSQSSSSSVSSSPTGSSGSSTVSSSGSSTGSPTGSGSGAGSGSGNTTPTVRTATISWSAPTTNTNGSALTNLSGYRLYYGTSSASLSQEIDISGASTLQYVVTGLVPGTWYFAVASVTNDGEESALSTVVSKTIS